MNLGIRYKAIAIQTKYWQPKDDYIRDIICAIKKIIVDEDIITISEKAISIALGNIYDEKKIIPSRLARYISKYWMRIVWPYILGPLCHLREGTIKSLKLYPIKEGSHHKQLAIKKGGILQALLHGSEAAIDGSNLPFSYVCLPLNNPIKVMTEAEDLPNHYEAIKARIEND